MNMVSFDEAVENQKKQRHELEQKQFKQWLRRGIFHVSAGLFIAWVSISPSFQLHVSIVNPSLLTNQAVRDMIQNPWMNRVYFAYGPLMFHQVNEHPLIQDFYIKPYAINKWELYITPHRPLAMWVDPEMILLENGDIFHMLDADLQRLSPLPIVSGYEDKLAQQALAQALYQLEEGSFNLISEIIQDAKSYDLNYAHVIMQDGLHVYTSLKTLDLLNNFLAIKRALNPEHNCIVIDEITSVPYSFSCTP
jgi:hypothetical protein